MLLLTRKLHSLSLSLSSKLAYVASKDTMCLLLGQGRRLNDLGFESRVFILDGLQRVGIFDEEQKYARNIVLSIAGEDLAIMKAILDSRGEWHRSGPLSCLFFYFPREHLCVLKTPC